VKRAEQQVNAGLSFAGATLPSVVGVDLASTAGRIAAWGGDSQIYAWSLSQVELTPTNARSIATVAGWRAGVVGLRDAALELIPTVAGSAAALGIRESDLAEFAASQATDPFAWLATQSLVATVGGFRGLGGPWAALPTAAVAVSAGEFRISTGAEQWRLFADVFGARVSPADGVADDPELSPPPAVVAVVSADSYFVRLERR
jgi:hypothetical protein